MYETEHLRPLLVDIAHEHRDLRRRLHELRALVQMRERGLDISQRLAQMTASLADLHNTMEAHFAQEESGGVIVEAVIRLPRLAEEAAAIEREHPELLLEIEALRRMVQASDCSRHAWKHVCAAVERIVQRLLNHEAAENRLLGEGFNEDIEALM